MELEIFDNYFKWSRQPKSKREYFHSSYDENLFTEIDENFLNLGYSRKYRTILREPVEEDYQKYVSKNLVQYAIYKKIKLNINNKRLIPIRYTNNIYFDPLADKKHKIFLVGDDNKHYINNRDFFWSLVIIDREDEDFY